MMPPDARRKTFPAMGSTPQRAGSHALSCPPRPVPLRHVTPGGDGLCLPFYRATRLKAEQREAHSPEFHRRSGNGLLKTGRVLRFREDGLA